MRPIPIESLTHYAQAHTTALDPLLQELIEETQAELAERAGMLSGLVEGSLLQFLVASSGAKRVLEIGMFTGFSALMMAAALPDNGELLTCDISARHIAFGKRYFERSPHGRKITVLEGAALDNIKKLDGVFDFVFIDADKPNYTNYYEAVLPSLRRTGSSQSITSSGPARSSTRRKRTRRPSSRSTTMSRTTLALPTSC